MAARQYGVVSRAQLLELGLGQGTIHTRLTKGRLHRLHAGVYSVGHRAITREGAWLAAVLASGETAVLSHHSAAVLWGIRRVAREGIHVTTARALRRSRAIRRHEVPLPRDETTTRRRIPVTTLPRTLFDISAETSIEGLEGAIREAEYLHRFRLASLERALERHPGRRGATTIRACLRRLGAGPRGRTRSRLEIRFAALLAHSDLPNPELNVLLNLGGSMIEADCLWRAQRVIVELDGGQAHRTQVAFESDRERDRRLQAAGWKVIRVTWRQLKDPTPLLDDLRRLLDGEPAIPTHIGEKLQVREGLRGRT